MDFAVYGGNGTDRQFLFKSLETTAPSHAEPGDQIAVVQRPNQTQWKELVVHQLRFLEPWFFE